MVYPQRPWLFNGFPMVFPSFFRAFPWFYHGFPWFYHGFTHGFTWFYHNFPLVSLGLAPARLFLVAQDRGHRGEPLLPQALHGSAPRAQRGVLRLHLKGEVHVRGGVLVAAEPTHIYSF